MGHGLLTTCRGCLNNMYTLMDTYTNDYTRKKNCGGVFCFVCFVFVLASFLSITTGNVQGHSSTSDTQAKRFSLASQRCERQKNLMACFFLILRRSKETKPLQGHSLMCIFSKVKNSTPQVQARIPRQVLCYCPATSTGSCMRSCH